jgi:hypothetical protein
MDAANEVQKELLKVTGIRVDLSFVEKLLPCCSLEPTSQKASFPARCWS